ncbi:MAG TPA: hypothetical protein VF175_04305 [Lacipirellula sp.]
MRNAECEFRRSVGVTVTNFLALLALVFCTTGASCTRAVRSPFGPWTPPAPEVLATGSSLDQVIAAVNQNAAKINSYQTNNASITVPGMPAIPLLRGNIAAQRPGRVRLQASTLMGPEVDLGANEELFWFWVKRNEPPALYFARHDQFCGSAAQKLMPIEPQWLLDAIGFAEFRPTDQHTGPLPLGDGKIEITSTIDGRCGPMTKKTVIDARLAWVLEQHVYDGNGTLVASTIAKSHRYDNVAGVSIPQEIEIRIPASELSLSIDVGRVEINTLADNPQLWTMPTMSGTPQVDLGSTPQAGGVRPAGDLLTEANWYGPGPAVSVPTAIASVQPAIPVIQPPAPVANTAATAAPQFLSPGGVAQLPGAAVNGAAEQGMQRLPAGGVTADSAFIR